MPLTDLPPTVPPEAPRPFQFSLAQMLMMTGIWTALVGVVRWMALFVVAQAQESDWGSLEGGICAVLAALVGLAVVFEIGVVLPLLIAVVWLQNLRRQSHAGPH